MGNSASNPASTVTTPTIPSKIKHHSTPSGSARKSLDESPRTGRRRQKSIEFTDIGQTAFTPQTNAATGRDKRGVSHGRKHVGKIAELEADDEIAEGTGGTLRGAMQGKADHVVYGPRRIDGIAPGTPGVSSVSAATSGASSPIIVSRDSSSPASSKNHTRPNSIALPPSISVFSPAQLVDPDDTTSPHFTNSARLTSQVLLSQDRMPVIVSPITEEPPRMMMADGRELRQVEYGLIPHVFTPSLLSTGMSTPDALVPPGSSAPFPPVELPSETIFTKTKSIADKSDGILTPVSIASASSSFTSPQLLLSPEILKAPSAAVPIPITSITSSGSLASSLLASVVDLGAGPDGVPTLIKWTNEDGQSVGGDGVKEEGPKEVFVTGTFAKGWKTKIELRKTAGNEFSALISLPPGPHRLKFIVDKEWKASKHLPAATDADGNLINYVHVKGPTATSTVAAYTPSSLLPGTSPSSRTWNPNMPIDLNDSPDDPSFEAEDEEWTQEIPAGLIEWGEWEAERENYEIALESAKPPPASYSLPPAPLGGGVPPPSLPAQLEKGPLNHAAYVTQGSGDDNSILPKPDHSVINHLAASPIKGGFLSVGVTTRYKRKFVTIVYYKALNP